MLNKKSRWQSRILKYPECHGEDRDDSATSTLPLSLVWAGHGSPTHTSQVAQGQASLSPFELMRHEESLLGVFQKEAIPFALGGCEQRSIVGCCCNHEHGRNQSKWSRLCGNREDLALAGHRWAATVQVRWANTRSCFSHFKLAFYYLHTHTQQW